MNTTGATSDRPSLRAANTPWPSDDRVQVLVNTHPSEDLNTRAKRVEAYLWSNFEISGLVYLTADEAEGSFNLIQGDGVLVISGVDKAGWTADALVERLASGLIFGEVRRGDDRVFE